MTKPKFLLGSGELLTENIPAPGGGGEKKQVYTWTEAKKQLLPQLQKASTYLDLLPPELCPNDYSVIKLILNPSYIAKSFFPGRFLDTMALKPIGSRSETVTPKKWSKKVPPIECTSTGIFVAGKRSSFRAIPEHVSRMSGESGEAKEFCRIESILPFYESEKVKSNPSGSRSVCEVALHTVMDQDETFAIVSAFETYVRSLGGVLVKTSRFQVQTLLFFPVEINQERIVDLAKFSFVRVIRPMPQLRNFRPFRADSGSSIPCRLPEGEPLSSEPRVALLDGGLPSEHPISAWVREAPARNSDNSYPGAQEHGLGVASAFLFGSLSSSRLASRPLSRATCIPIVASPQVDGNDMELYDTLGNIEEVLLSRQYDFLNLSLGPDLPVEDNDVHAWTSVIDSYLGDGDTLMTVAVGNNGHLDSTSGNARVQVPSDCVNALSVGASDLPADHDDWARAVYSALGPGRRPGVIKPDVIAFGGSHQRMFSYLQPGYNPAIGSGMGTSFSAPLALRTAVGISAMIGSRISPLAIKALMIHSAKNRGHASDEVGWGIVPSELSEIIECPDGMVRVLYSGQLMPGKYIRARVPVPPQGITGKIRMRATFCYACQVDPQDSASYTRSGLEVTFRPDLDKKRKGSDMAATRGFFKMDRYSPEQERRSDFGKWETVLHDEDGMLGSTLKYPAFDIHYNARESGAQTRNATPIKYALVITIEAPKHASIYSDIVEAYSSILVPLEPRIELPIGV